MGMRHRHGGIRPAQVLYEALTGQSRLNSLTGWYPRTQFSTCTSLQRPSGGDELLRLFDEPKRTPPSDPFRSASRSQKPTSNYASRRSEPQLQGQSRTSRYNPFERASQQSSYDSSQDRTSNSGDGNPLKNESFGPRVKSVLSGQRSGQNNNLYEPRRYGSPQSYGRPVPERNTSRASDSQYNSFYDRSRQGSSFQGGPALSQYQPAGRQPTLPPRDNFIRRDPRAVQQAMALRRIRAEERKQYPELTLDEDIPARFIRIPDPDNSLSPARSLPEVLREINRETTWLRQLNQVDENDTAICRLLDKEEYRKSARQRQMKEKERKKESGKLNPKQVEINWMIGSNDLNHKLKQIQALLEKGRRVDVMIASKTSKTPNKQRGTNLELGRTVINAVKGRLDEIGASEWKQESGILPEQVYLHLQTKK